MTQTATPKLSRGDVIENQTERYAAARRVVDEEGIRIKHIRPFVLDEHEPTFLHNGGMTVAYRQLPTDTFVEVATALCSKHDIYNRKVGTVIAVEQFANLHRIRVPAFGLTPEEVVDALFGRHHVFVESD